MSQDNYVKFTADRNQDKLNQKKPELNNNSEVFEKKNITIDDKNFDKDLDDLSLKIKDVDFDISDLENEIKQNNKNNQTKQSVISNSENFLDDNNEEIEEPNADDFKNLEEINDKDKEAANNLSNPKAVGC